MIRYKTHLGFKHLNARVRETRDYVYKPALKGMHCRKCSTDTEIKFVPDSYGAFFTEIDACCQDFNNRIKDKLEIVA